jgi:hypothetical protein
VRSDAVVFGLASMDGLHIEGIAQDEGDALAATHVGEPVPGEDTFAGDDEILAIGRNGFETRFWAGLHIAVERDLAIPVQDTDIHGTGKQVDTPVKLVLVGVESQQVLLLHSYVNVVAQGQHTTMYAGEEASIRIKGMQPTRWTRAADAGAVRPCERQAVLRGF